MKYSEIVQNNRTELIEREDLEWSNFCWDRANCNDKKKSIADW